MKERLLLTEAAWKKSDQRNSELEKQVAEARTDKENEAKAMEVPFHCLLLHSIAVQLPFPLSPQQEQGAKLKEWVTEKVAHLERQAQDSIRIERSYTLAGQTKEGLMISLFTKPKLCVCSRIGLLVSRTERSQGQAGESRGKGKGAGADLCHTHRLPWTT